MSARDWVREGELAARYWMQPTGSKRTAQLVKQIVQPSRPAILADIKQKRIDADAGNRPKELSFGRYLGSIPTVDIIRLQKEQPEIFSGDAEIARKALIKFWNSPDAELFRVQRA